MKQLFTIRELETLRPVMLQVWNAVKGAVEGGPVEVTIRRVSKSREQEEKYHAMIRDIHKTVDTDRGYTFRVWKALLVDQYEQELLGMNEPLTHPGQVVISLDGQRGLTVRPSTTEFRKFEASGFIQFLYAWGVDHDATFSEKSINIYNEYRQAA